MQAPGGSSVPQPGPESAKVGVHSQAPEFPGAFLYPHDPGRSQKKEMQRSEVCCDYQGLHYDGGSPSYQLEEEAMAPYPEQVLVLLVL